jgi:phytoene synthase
MQTSRRITRKSASNLALAFALLPKEKRDAMSALYAFCREVDDVADEDSIAPETRREQLRAWREDIRRACQGGEAHFEVNQELQPFIHRYSLRFELFNELIQGCEMDLETVRYATAERLERYCYRVASVVGLLSIEIFGYQNPACQQYAVELGQALQLTNILRDVQCDGRRGRIYLPQSLLAECHVDEAEILEGKYSERFAAVGRALAATARQHYARARRVLPEEDRRAMVAAELMGSVYWRLLMRIEAQGFDVFRPERVRLAKPHKLLLILGAAWRHATRSRRPTYGMS